MEKHLFLVIKVPIPRAMHEETFKKCIKEEILTIRSSDVITTYQENRIMSHDRYIDLFKTMKELSEYSEKQPLKILIYCRRLKGKIKKTNDELQEKNKNKFDEPIVWMDK